jgi:hypothetical protein
LIEDNSARDDGLGPKFLSTRGQSEDAWIDGIAVGALGIVDDGGRFTRLMG